MKYLSDKEIKSFDGSELKKAEKAKMDVRKKARSLCAGVVMKDENGFDKKIEGMLSYFYDIPEDEVNARIMEAFLTPSDYEDYVKLNDKKYIYDRLSESEKKKTINPRCVRDFFDVPTGYHFYKYLQMIGLKFNEMRAETGVRRRYFKGNEKAFNKPSSNIYESDYNLRSVTGLLKYAFDCYASLPKDENMFFQRRDIKLNLKNEPIKSFRSLKKMEEKRMLDRINDPNTPSESVREEFERDVFLYMLGYIAKEKGVDVQTQNNIIAKMKGERYLGFDTMPDRLIPKKKEAVVNEKSAVESENSELDGQIGVVEYIKLKQQKEVQEKEEEELYILREMEKTKNESDFEQLTMKGYRTFSELSVLGTFELHMRNSGFEDYIEGESDDDLLSCENI